MVASHLRESVKQDSRVFPDVNFDWKVVKLEFGVLPMEDSFCLTNKVKGSFHRNTIPKRHCGDCPHGKYKFS